MDDGYRLAYDEVVRALSQQATALEALRTRAGLLLSAASIATSFLGGQALDGGKLDAVRWLAIAAFVGLAISVLYVLWPRWERRPAAMPSRLLDGEANSLPAATRTLSLYLEATYVANDHFVDRLSRGLRIAIVLLALEVGAWIAALVAG